MPAKKRFLQKVSTFFCYVCFLLSALCGVALAVKAGEASMAFRASFGASLFFFAMVGVVLKIMGKADLPDFKPGQTES